MRNKPLSFDDIRKENEGTMQNIRDAAHEMTTDTHDTKHTPGPWVITGNGPQYAKYGIAGADKRSVCALPSSQKRTAAEKQANAKLIASAPALLAENAALLTVQAELVRALEQVSKQLELYGHISTGGGIYSIVTDALALARGGAK